MKLNKLRIRNFKGISHRIVDFDDNTAITGATGSGKTSVFDSFLWLISDVDSTGRIGTGKGSFKINPLDKDDKPIQG